MSKFIEATNNTTVWENRWLNLSPSIQEEAKYITLAEIKRTVDENKHPQGSKIIGREIEEDCQEINFHVIKTSLFSENK